MSTIIAVTGKYLESRIFLCAIPLAINLTVTPLLVQLV